jgi:hypothetical protein
MEQNKQVTGWLGFEPESAVYGYLQEFSKEPREGVGVDE